MKTAERKRRAKKSLIGLKFGKWTIVEEVEPLNLRDGLEIRRSVVVECSCDLKTRETTLIRNLWAALRHGATLDCGCSKKKSKTQFLESNFPEIKKSGNTLTAYSCLNNVYHSYKNGANKRGYSFELSREQFFNVVTKPCTYCGAIPTKSRKIIGDKTELQSDIKYNGIDRYDNTKGYTLENSVPCCTKCNQDKRIFDGPEFKIARKLREIPIDEREKLVEILPNIIKQFAGVE